MPEIEPKEKRAKSSLSEFQAFSGKPCCRQTKYNSTRPKTRSKCEGQATWRPIRQSTASGRTASHVGLADFYEGFVQGSMQGFDQAGVDSVGYVGFLSKSK